MKIREAAALHKFAEAAYTVVIKSFLQIKHFCCLFRLDINMGYDAGSIA